MTDLFGVQFYPTPPKVVESMVSGLSIGQRSRVLDPSAGDGSILDYLAGRTRTVNRKDFHTDIDEEL